MKKFFFLLVLSVVCSLYVFSQSIAEDVNTKPLLFKKFLNGKVIMKSGSEENVAFDYNTDNQQLIFLDNGQYMVLAGLETIKEIVIGNTIFVPIKGKIFEKTSRSDLFVSYSNKPVAKDVGSDKTGTTVRNAGEVSNTVTAYVDRRFESKSDLKFIKNFWLQKDNNLVLVSSSKQLAKVSKVNKEAITEYVEKNKPNFNSEADVLKLLDYLATAK